MGKYLALDLNPLFVSHFLCSAVGSRGIIYCLENYAL
jgi:hypothetical protein